MTVKQKIVDALESILRWVYQWLTDNDKILGKILYTLHLISLLVIVVMIVVSHIFYPVIWFQVFVFLIVFIIWLQHVLLHSCVCSSLERKLMGGDARLAVDIILEVLRIPITKESRMGVTVLLSTVGVLFLGLELFARAVMYAREYYGFSRWA